MRIFFWAGDNWTGCTWYRCVLPRIGLTWLGHDVTIGLTPPPDILDYDAVFGSRISHPDHIPVWRWLASEGKRIILDLDDDYFHMGDDQPQEVTDDWNRLRPGLIECIGMSSTISVASPGLQEVLSDYHQDVRIIPNSLPAQVNMQRRDYTAKDRDLIIGWAGSASTIKHITPELKRAYLLATRRKNTGVLFVGVPPNAQELKGLDNNPQLRVTGYIRSQDKYLEACSMFDIWTAPYGDTIFNRNKYPTKVLESQAMGIPLVASAIRSYEERIEHGKTGFLVKREHEWSRYIKKLMDNPDLRQEIGLNARDAASAYQLQSVNQVWEQVAKG